MQTAADHEYLTSQTPFDKLSANMLQMNGRQINIRPAPKDVKRSPEPFEIAIIDMQTVRAHGLWVECFNLLDTHGTSAKDLYLEMDYAHSWFGLVTYIMNRIVAEFAMEFGSDHSKLDHGLSKSNSQFDKELFSFDHHHLAELFNDMYLTTCTAIENRLSFPAQVGTCMKNAISTFVALKKAMYFQYCISRDSGVSGMEAWVAGTTTKDYKDLPNPRDDPFIGPKIDKNWAEVGNMRSTLERDIFESIVTLVKGQYNIGAENQASISPIKRMFSSDSESKTEKTCTLHETDGDSSMLESVSEDFKSDVQAATTSTTTLMVPRNITFDGPRATEVYHGVKKPMNPDSSSRKPPNFLQRIFSSMEIKSKEKKTKVNGSSSNIVQMLQEDISKTASLKQQNATSSPNKLRHAKSMGNMANTENSKENGVRPKLPLGLGHGEEPTITNDAGTRTPPPKLRTKRSVFF